MKATNWGLHSLRVVYKLTFFLNFLSFYPDVDHVTRDKWVGDNDLIAQIINGWDDYNPENSDPGVEIV